MLLNLFLSETSSQMMLKQKGHWRPTYTLTSTPIVYENSAHQNLLHYWELQYFNKETATKYTRQKSTLSRTHWGLSRELPASKMLWSDWILRFPRRTGSPEPRWEGATNQAKATTLDFGHTLPILPRDWQSWVWLRRLPAILRVKTPPDCRDCSHTAAIPLSELINSIHTLLFVSG